MANGTDNKGKSEGVDFKVLARTFDTKRATGGVLEGIAYGQAVVAWCRSNAPEGKQEAPVATFATKHGLPQQRASEAVALATASAVADLTVLPFVNALAFARAIVACKGAHKLTKLTITF